MLLCLFYAMMYNMKLWFHLWDECNMTMQNECLLRRVFYCVSSNTTAHNSFVVRVIKVFLSINFLNTLQMRLNCTLQQLQTKFLFFALAQKCLSEVWEFNFRKIKSSPRTDKWVIGFYITPGLIDFTYQRVPKSLADSQLHCALLVFIRVQLVIIVYLWRQHHSNTL